MDDIKKYRPSNQLQKDCLRQFRKWFPDLVDKIKFKEPIMHPDNFCFSVSSDSPEFGEITFDIDDQEITIFTQFDHHHYETYLYDDEKSEYIKKQRTIYTALMSIKELINGNEVIELEKKGGIIIKAYRFHKDYPENKMSVVINLESESEKLDSNPTIPIEKILVNWNGLISKEITTNAANYKYRALGRLFKFRK